MQLLLLHSGICCPSRSSIWRMTRLNTARHALRTSLLNAWLFALALASSDPPDGAAPYSRICAHAYKKPLIGNSTLHEFFCTGHPSFLFSVCQR